MREEQLKILAQRLQEFLCSPIFRVVNVIENINWEYMSSSICVFYHSIKIKILPYSSNKAYTMSTL